MSKRSTARLHGMVRALAMLATLYLAVPGGRCGTAAAQQRDSSLSQTEIETLRETAYVPPERLLAFVSFLDARAHAVEALATGKRHAGREDDIHDLLVQFASIDDDLEDNLDDWDKRRRDLRKALPKLIAAIDRWATELRTPADDERYNVARKLALEGIAQTRDDAQKLLAGQVEYFKTHKPDDRGSTESTGKHER